MSDPSRVRRVVRDTMRSGRSPPADELPENQRGDAWEPANGEHPKAESVERRDAPDVFTAAALLQMQLPEPKCVVKDLLPEGLDLLCGKPKLGKSWLALNIALAIASGGIALGSIQVEQGQVLDSPGTRPPPHVKN